MSLSRSLSRICVAGLLCGALAACGFQPLYYKDGQRVSIKDELKGIYIHPIADRIGQQLRTELAVTLDPRTDALSADWHLLITLTESTRSVSVESTNFATRIDLFITAHVQLNPYGDDTREAMQTRLQAISSYNLADSQYANLIDRRDARLRAVVALSGDIRRQLALWLRRDRESGS